MNIHRCISLLFCALLSTQAGLLNSLHAGSESKRIEVYRISQSFWDVKPGDTLGEIVQQLLPDNPAMHKRMIQEIMQLNPDAFSNSSPSSLKAHVKLWLPNNAPMIKKQIDKNTHHVQSFSWGQVITPK